MKTDFFNNGVDYWNVAHNIKNIYTSDGSMSLLLDFERVLDEIDLYAFKNWQLGELVEGPTSKRYNVTCVFMWTEDKMPDPRGAKRLLPFDCDVKYKKTSMKVPIKIKSYDDFMPGTKKAKIIEKKIWLVEITIPRHLMSNVRTGSVELENQDLDLEELDMSYEKDLDEQENKSDESQQQQQQMPTGL